jgi:translation initiation factor 2D
LKLNISTYKIINTTQNVQEEAAGMLWSYCQVLKLTTEQIKPLSPLRSSDRRKLADQIIADFSLQPAVPSLPETATEEEKAAASTAAVSALRNALLPDHALSARFTTTIGADSRRVFGQIYVGAWKGGDQRILWFREGEGQLVPTGKTSSH